MKIIITTALLFLPALLFSQHAKQKYYRNLVGLESPDTILYKCIAGGFAMGGSFESHGYHFDSSMRFEEFKSGDVEYYEAIDSGSWTIRDGKLILQSLTKRTKFDIVKFYKFYFFVLPEQRKWFLKEYRHFMDVYKEGESIKIDEQITATQHLAAWRLSKMFYSVRIDGTAGAWQYWRSD